MKPIRPRLGYKYVKKFAHLWKNRFPYLGDSGRFTLRSETPSALFFQGNMV